LWRRTGQHQVGGAGPGNQFTGAVGTDRLGNGDLAAAVNHPADAAQHSGLDGDWPDEIDGQVDGGEVFPGCQCGDHGEPHGAVQQ
jgi:hypothetical protein